MNREKFMAISRTLSENAAEDVLFLKINPTFQNILSKNSWINSVIMRTSNTDHFEKHFEHFEAE